MIDLRGKTILITGSSGLLGHALVKKLKERGIKQDNLILPSHKKYDLTRQDQVEKLFHTFKPEIVFHLAVFFGGIKTNQEHPGKIFYDNMLMGTNIIEACREYNVKKLVLPGSQCSYGNNTEVPFNEANLLNGEPNSNNFHYGIVKRSLGVMLDAYYKEYQLKSAYPVMANIFGEYDRFLPNISHVVPDLVRKFMYAKNNNKNEVILWGSGKQVRQFLYSEDAAEALILMAENIDNPEPINIAGEQIEISKLAKIIAKLLNYSGWIIFNGNKKMESTIVRISDTDKMRNVLHFKPKTDIIEGLQKTIDWYKNSLVRAI